MKREREARQDERNKRLAQTTRLSPSGRGVREWTALGLSFKVGGGRGETRAGSQGVKGHLSKVIVARLCLRLVGAKRRCDMDYGVLTEMEKGGGEGEIRRE